MPVVVRAVDAREFHSWSRLPSVPSLLGINHHNLAKLVERRSAAQVWTLGPAQPRLVRGNQAIRIALLIQIQVYGPLHQIRQRRDERWRIIQT